MRGDETWGAEGSGHEPHPACYARRPQAAAGLPARLSV